MSLFSKDTHPDVIRLLVAGYRRMSPAQRLARALDLSRAARQMAEAGIRTRYPRATDREVRLRLASLVLDRRTMIRAFGWDPAKEGR